MKNRAFDILLFLIGLALGIIIIGTLFLFTVDAKTVDEEYTRTIESVPDPVTIVPIEVLPTFIKGLAKGEPPVVVEEVVVYVREGTLTASNGRIKGPTNEETYYNLDMSRVVDTMRRKGFSEEEYPYYIREDGVKMLGDYVMVAADLDIHPRGVVVETSLGQGLVCDTGEFEEDIYDIATDW